jgi:hypothetical protein
MPTRSWSAFATPETPPANTERAAASASSGSDLPSARRARRSGRLISSSSNVDEAPAQGRADSTEMSRRRPAPHRDCAMLRDRATAEGNLPGARGRFL